MPILIGDKKPKFFLGDVKVKKIYKGSDKVWSGGSAVTYKAGSSQLFDISFINQYANQCSIGEDGYITVVNNSGYNQFPSMTLNNMNGQYTLTVEVVENTNEKSAVYFQENGNEYNYPIKKDSSVTKTFNGFMRVLFAVPSGSRMICRVMLNKGDVALPFEPYRENDSYVVGAQLANIPDIEPITKTGITWSCKDGAVTAKGTATGTASSQNAGIQFDLPIVAGEYFISGTSGEIYVYCQIRRADGTSNYPTNKSFKLDGTEELCRLYLQITKDKTVDGTVYPMLNKGSVALPFEPYMESGTITLEVDSDESCLDTVVTPYKDGWTFKGWREDTVASGDVLTERLMGDEPITLYAVFEKDITLTTVSNGVTTEHKDKAYYNNGNVIYPTFSVSDPSKSGATFNGWSNSSSSTSVAHSSINGLTLDADTTLYAVFKYNNVTIPSKSMSHTDKFLPESQASYVKSTLYSSVDLSKFGSATLNFSNIAIKQNFSWSTLNLVVICGGASVTLFTSKKDADTLTETAKSGTKTLTFSNTSGTYAMTAEVTGNGQGNSCYYTISGTLVGRTVVG